MVTVINILTVAFLGAVLFQDVKSRAVSWFLFPLLVVASLVKSFSLLPFDQLAIQVMSNMSVLGIMIALLFLYYLIKNKAFTNLFEAHLGLGDLFFWIVACMCFSAANFILFFLFSLVFSLLVHLIVVQVSRSQRSIPLAGYQSAFLAGLILIEPYFSTGFYLKDEWLLFLI